MKKIEFLTNLSNKIKFTRIPYNQINVHKNPVTQNLQQSSIVFLGKKIGNSIKKIVKKKKNFLFYFIRYLPQGNDHCAMRIHGQ